MHTNKMVVEIDMFSFFREKMVVAYELSELGKLKENCLDPSITIDENMLVFICPTSMNCSTTGHKPLLSIWSMTSGTNTIKLLVCSFEFMKVYSDIRSYPLFCWPPNKYS